MHSGCPDHLSFIQDRTVIVVPVVGNNDPAIGSGNFAIRVFHGFLAYFHGQSADIGIMVATSAPFPAADGSVQCGRFTQVINIRFISDAQHHTRLPFTGFLVRFRASGLYQRHSGAYWYDLGSQLNEAGVYSSGIKFQDRYNGSIGMQCPPRPGPG